MEISSNINNIVNRVKKACERVNRDPKSVKTIAVSKTVTANNIKIAVESGITHIGENRVQEAWEKYQKIGNIAEWHLVGHLQTNKVKRALQFFDVIHSVDSVHLAEEINRRALAIQKKIDILLEVNTSDETTKYGLAPEDTISFLKKIKSLPALKIRGLMTVGVFLPEPEAVRPCFRLLKQLQNKINNEGMDSLNLAELSMGMTNDFEVAIEEGATMIRIGRAIFGERNY